MLLRLERKMGRWEIMQDEEIGGKEVKMKMSAEVGVRMMGIKMMGMITR